MGKTNKSQMYFRVRGTADELDFFIEPEIRKYCKDNNLELKYFRKIKSGHIPTYREVKVMGGRGQLIVMREHFDDTIDEEWRR